MAWRRSNDGETFREELEKFGFVLCNGDGGKAMVLTPKGVLYRLAASVSSGAKAEGLAITIKAADIHDRVASLVLPSVTESRQRLIASPPIDGWQSITGLERSTHNLADPSRNILLQKPLIETDAPILAMGQCPTPGDLTPPLMLDIQNINFTPDKRPKLTADQAVEAENYFRALRKLNSAQPPMSKAAEIDPNNSDMFKPTAMAQGGVDWPITKSESSSVTLLVKGHARAHTYKAALAGVHQQHGQLIKWVDRSVEGDARIHLKDGTILQATSSSIPATKSTEEAITIIVSYAVQRKMRTVSITSSSQKIRNVCARRLIRAGIAVSDHDLQHIVNDEQIRAEMITKLIEWRSLRNATFNHDDIANISKLAMAIDVLQPYFDRINRVYPKSFALIASDNDALNALQNGQVDVGISEPGWANPNSSFKC